MSKTISIFNTASECVCETEDPEIFDISPTFIKCVMTDEEGSYEYIYPVCNISEIRILEYHDD